MKWSYAARPMPAMLLVVAFAAGIVAGTASSQDKTAPTAAPAASPPASPAGAAPLPKIDTLKRIRETSTILIGVRESSVPFSFVDAQKQPQGYSVDLCQ